MKLTEIYQPNLIETPEIGPVQNLDLKDPTILDQLEKTSFNIEGYPLYSKKFGDQYVFAIKENGNILSVLVAREIVDFPSKKKTLQVQRSYTPSEHRNKGYAYALYYGLARLAYTLISDTLQLQPVYSLWKKLEKALPSKVKYFDISKNQYTTEEPYNNKSVVFVLETQVEKQQGILLDSKYFTADGDFYNVAD